MDCENEENLDYYQPGIFLFAASSERPMSNLSLQELTLLFHPTLSWIELEQWCPSNKQKRGMPLWAAVAKCYKKNAVAFTSYILLLCELLTNLELHLLPLLSPAPVSWGHPGSTWRRHNGENDTNEQHLKLCFSSLASSHVSRRGFLTPAATRAWITSTSYWFLWPKSPGQ